MFQCLNVCAGKTETKRETLLIKNSRVYPRYFQIWIVIKILKLQTHLNDDRCRNSFEIVTQKTLLSENWLKTSIHIHLYLFVHHTKLFSLDIYAIKQNFHYPILYRKIMKWEEIQHLTTITALGTKSKNMSILPHFVSCATE